MRKVSAYMTVEASLIMPVVLIVYLLLIQYCLWIYDRCVLEQDMAAVLLRCNNTNEEAWQQIYKEWDREKYIWIIPEKPILQQKAGKLKLIEAADGGTLGEIQVHYEAQQVSPISWLRMKRQFVQKINTGKEE